MVYFILARIRGEVKDGKMFVNLLHKEDEVLKSYVRFTIEAVNMGFTVMR
jgi:hypothetical protein